MSCMHGLFWELLPEMWIIGSDRASSHRSVFDPSNYSPSLCTTRSGWWQKGMQTQLHSPTDRTACSACNPILVPHLCTLFHSSSSWSSLAFASSQLDKWYITALKSCIDPASGIVLVPVVSNGHSWNFYQLSSLVLSIIQHICYFLDFGGGMNANEIQMRPQISLLFAAFFSLNWLELVEWWTIWSNNPIRFSFVRQTLETRPFRNLHSPLPHRAFTAHSTDFRSISAMFKHVQPFSRFLAKQQLELTGLLVVRTQGRRPAFCVIYPLSSTRCSLSHWDSQGWRWMNISFVCLGLTLLTLKEVATKKLAWLPPES